MRVENDAALAEDIADGFERVLSGDALYRENVDCFGVRVREACFDRFSIFLAADPVASP